MQRVIEASTGITRIALIGPAYAACSFGLLHPDRLENQPLLRSGTRQFGTTQEEIIIRKSPLENLSHILIIGRRAH
jgi:hypothetical protein